MLAKTLYYRLQFNTFLFNKVVEGVVVCIFESPAQRPTEAYVYGDWSNQDYSSNGVKNTDNNPFYGFIIIIIIIGIPE